MKPFNQTINYSSTNEDSNSEILALDIKKTDTVLCITGSGGRSLDLLIKEPQKLISLDFNPCQNHLLELKIVAIKHFDYETFIQFMGIGDDINSVDLYEKLKNYLSDSARLFWDSNLKIIDKGVIYQGRWEKYFRLLSLIVRLTRPKRLSRLFEDLSIPGQNRIWTEEWNDWLWQKFLKTIGEKVFWKYILRDPGFYKYVPAEFDVPEYLIEQFNKAVRSFHFNESAFLTLLFWGRFNNDKVLPAYLKQENFSTLKNNVDHIEIVTAGLGEYLQNCTPALIDKYSLSDFSSYTDSNMYFDIWNYIFLTSRDKARICERQFLVKRDIPVPVKRYMKRDKELEEKLAQRDASVFYTFLVAEVCRSEK